MSFTNSSTSIMYQHTSIGNIISMIILNLEVVDGYGSLKNLVLDLLDNDIFTVDQNQNVACSKFDRFRPALDRGVEGMSGSGDDFLAIDEHMDKLVGFIDIGFDNLFQCNLAGFFVPCPDHVACLNRLDGNCTGSGENSGSGYEAVGGSQRSGDGTSNGTGQCTICHSIQHGISDAYCASGCRNVGYCSRGSSADCAGYKTDCSALRCTHRCTSQSSACTAGSNRNRSNSSHSNDHGSGNSQLLCPGGQIATRITEIDRVIEAVSKEIVAQEAALHTTEHHIICINKPTDLGIVVTALQVVEPGLSVVVVAVPFVKVIISHFKSLRKTENELNFTK